LRIYLLIYKKQCRNNKFTNQTDAKRSLLFLDTYLELAIKISPHPFLSDCHSKREYPFIPLTPLYLPIIKPRQTPQTQ